MEAQSVEGQDRAARPLQRAALFFNALSTFSLEVALVSCLQDRIKLFFGDGLHG